jgi:hypothetical protein
MMDSIFFVIDASVAIGFIVFSIFIIIYVVRSFGRGFVYINGKKAYLKKDSIGFVIVILSFVFLFALLIYASLLIFADLIEIPSLLM